MLRKVIRFKELFLCFFSAALLIFSFPNFSAVGGSAFGGNLWICAWFGFVPLFFALENKSKSKALLLSYFTGIIFWWGTIYWLVHVTLLGTAILIFYLALYFGLFGLLVNHRELRTMNHELLFVPSIWVLLEYLRSHLFTGFPWALLGYSQCLNLPAIQIADITGAWGVSFLVMIVNIVIYLVLSSQFLVPREKRKNLLFAAGVIILISLGYGYYKLGQQPTTNNQQPIKISVIQGNIPQELKWEPAAKDFIINKYLALTRQAGKDSPDLIVWPEASLPVVLEEEPAYFEQAKNFAKEINMPLLLGAVTTRNSLYYNSALLLFSKGGLQEKYDKLHLVPFGEYIPLRKILRFLETVAPIGDIAAGKEYIVFRLATSNQQPVANFSVLICFEDLFPELSRQFVKKGADFLVNITNDAWYKKTSAPYQHLQASVFRAVENRRYLVRSANTGVSGFIAPSGKIISAVKDSQGKDVFIPGYATQEIALTEKRLSFYSRYGDIFLIACFLLVLYRIMLPFRKK